jgi:hypothetical protein
MEQTVPTWHETGVVFWKNLGGRLSGPKRVVLCHISPVFLTVSLLRPAKTGFFWQKVVAFCQKKPPNYLLFFLIFTLKTLDIVGQQDSVVGASSVFLQQRVEEARLTLQHNVINDDPVEARIWLDSLVQLNDAFHVAIQWDERWLMYYWLGSYRTLLAEVAAFDADVRAGETLKTQPLPDSLFEVIDGTLFERRFDCFQRIRHAPLTDEEKTISTLVLEYLLRLNTNEDEWTERLNAFEHQYPKSRFNRFVRSVKSPILKPANKGFGLCAHFLSGTWSAALDRSLTPLYAAQFDLYKWVDRWTIAGSFLLGGSRLARDVTDGFDIWPKKDPANLVTFGIELGYDIINSSKVRLYPSFGGALAFLGPPTPSENADEPLPAYYDNFNYMDGHLTASLTADAKMFGEKTPLKGSYHGVRMRVGYHWLNFKRQNNMLAGTMFYFSVGYNLFVFKEAI